MPRCFAVAAALLIAACGTRPTPTSTPATGGARWFATWGASEVAAPARPPRDSIDRTPTLVGQTIRLIVRTSIGGDRARIHLSNEYGDRPLVIGAAHIAVRDTGAAIVASTDHALTFGGNAGITLRPGAVAVSDPVVLDVPKLADVAVSLYLADSARLATRHPLALQTNYVGRGNVTGSRAFAPDTTIVVWPFLTGIDVTNSAASGVIVTLGNSITDGTASTRNENRRWPNVLAQRLSSSTEPVKGVVNQGISGNRVLTFGAGPSALARFDRDVLMTPGVTHVVLLEGINDIGGSARDGISADDIIQGYRQLIERAHDRGVLIIGATLTPAGPRAPYTPELEAKRVAVNAFIRTKGAFDAVIDFDAATRDPAHPTQFLPTYDSGDHLHPSDIGYKAMGDAIDLSVFRATRR
jgi:lysophospholipase L1-like esterase